MPSDVSDLRDVVDAINKLCDTMKSSYADSDAAEEEAPGRDVAGHVGEEREPTPEIYERDSYFEPITFTEPATVPVVCDSRPMGPVADAYDTERVPVPVTRESRPVVVPVTRDSRAVIVTVARESQPVTTISYSESHTTTVPVTYQRQTPTVLPINDSQSTIAQISSESELTAALVFETEPVVESTPCEPTSEMYYTASSEVSLLSDMDLQERAQSEDSDRDRDDRNSVMAGHVAAMRERFESMTRTNTPCPDLVRSASPSFEVFRNVSTSPDVEKS